jgi:hypothetical protein
VPVPGKVASEAGGSGGRDEGGREPRHPRLPVSVPAGRDRDCAFLRAHLFAVEGQVVLARQAVDRRQRPPAARCVLPCWRVGRDGRLTATSPCRWHSNEAVPAERCSRLGRCPGRSAAEVGQDGEHPPVVVVGGLQVQFEEDGCGVLGDGPFGDE